VVGAPWLVLNGAEMMRQEVELLSDDSNRVILRTPGRNYPGMVLQGDTLANLTSLARDLAARVEGIGNQETADIAQELLEQLQDRLEHYESVLTQHGINLPYAK
jgi:hypothetical protein